MATGDNAAPVTRREFNNALLLVWTFIMLAFGTTIFRSGSRVPTSAIYCAAALLMVANYTIASWRDDVSRKRVIIAVLVAGVAVAVGIVTFVADGISH